MTKAMLQIAWLFLLAPLALAAQPECLRNTDCVIRPASCCKCSQGGKLNAVPENTPKPHCADRLCTQVMSKDKSCRAKKAICLNNKCELQF